MMGSKGFKKVRMAIVVFALVLVAALSVALTACSKSDEQAVRDLAAENLDLMKQADQTTMDGIMQSIAAGFDFSIYGLTAEDFYKSWTSGFDYSIDNVTINGDTATVSVTITCKSLQEVWSAWQNAVLTFSYTDEAKSMTPDAVNQAAGSMLTDAANNTVAKATSVDLVYVRSGNAWNPDPSYATEIAKAIG